MKKTEFTVAQLAAAVVGFYIFDKFGVTFRREYPPQTETGYLTQAEWQARYGGSQLDYEDWLRGQ